MTIPRANVLKYHCPTWQPSGGGKRASGVYCMRMHVKLQKFWKTISLTGI